MSGPYQQPPQQPRYQYAPPQPHGGPPPPPARGKNSKTVLAIVAALLVVAAGVAGVVFLGGDDGDEGPGSGDGGTAPVLAAHPDLRQLPFPDAAALNYADGPEAVCAAVAEVMTARNYAFQSAEESSRGIDCWFITPAVGLTEDGAYNFTTNVFVSQGADAGPAYDAFLNGIESNRRQTGSNPDYEWSPLYELPAGEAGWITHSADTARGRGDGTASFRQGDTTYYLTVFGWTDHQGTHGAGDQLTEEVTFQEITDIVKALSGDDSAGLPQLNPSAAVEYAGLPDFGAPLLTTETDACDPVSAAVEDQRLVQQVGPGGSGYDSAALIPALTCAYEPSDAAFQADGLTDIFTTIRVTQEYYGNPENDTTFPGMDLNHEFGLDMSEDSALYELPAGASGYLITDAAGDTATLKAGYVVDDYFVHIEISGSQSEDFESAPIPEETLVDTLSGILTAMNG